MKVRNDDKKLLEGCLQKDRNSQRLLYEKYAPTMLAICMRYANCKDEAEDIMIEGFINVYQKIESYRGDSSLEYWIKRIMTNGAISYFRKHSKHYNHTSFDEYPNFEIEDQNAKLESSYSQKELLRLIQEMPEYLRIVLNLRAFEAYTYKEISDELGVSEGTLRTRFSKAKKWLEDRMTPTAPVGNKEQKE